VPNALVIEDAPNYRQVFVRLLEELGWTVNEASSYEEAASALARSVPEAALLDLGLPRENRQPEPTVGFDLLRELKGAGVRVVVCSGYAAMEDDALRLGADGFVSKNAPDLRTRIQQFFTRGNGGGDG